LFEDEIIEKTMSVIKERTSHYIALLTAQHATLYTHVTWVISFINTLFFVLHLHFTIKKEWSEERELKLIL
jgi:hypothetical protein